MAKVAAFAALPLASAFVSTPSSTPKVTSSQVTQEGVAMRATGTEAPATTGSVAAFGAAAAVTVLVGGSRSKRSMRIARRDSAEYKEATAVAVEVEAPAPAPAAAAAFDPAKQLGVQAPTGFWDPCGLCVDITEEEFKRLRSCEYKHGRIAMIACSGFLMTTAGIRLPGSLSPSMDLKFEDMPSGLAAISKMPDAGWMQILLFGALVEFGSGIEEWKKNAPGDYGMGNFGLLGPVTDPVKKERGLNSELANGRLAMIAITGMLVQNAAFNGDGPEMWLPSA